MTPLRSRDRRAGRLLVNTGLAAATLQAIVFGTDGGAFVFFLFLSFLTFPMAAAALAAVVTGRRLAAGTATSRFPGTIAGLILTLGGGYWTAFLLNGEPGGPWYVDTRAALSILTLFVVALTLASGIATVQLFARPRLRPLGWNGGVTAVGTLLVITLLGDLVVLFTQPVALTQPYDCATVRDRATHRVQDLKTGSPAPPSLRGYRTLGAYILEPTTAPAIQINDNQPISAGSAPILVVTVKARIGGKHIDRDAKAAISKAGLNARGQSSSTENGRLSSYSIGYDGASSGSITYVRCKGDDLVVVTQAILPERVGVCAGTARAQCARLAKLSAPATGILKGLFLDGGQATRTPHYTTQNGRVILTISVTTIGTTFAFVHFDEIDQQMQDLGWKPAHTSCAASPCSSVLPDITRAEWTRPGLRATIRVEPTQGHRARVTLTVG